MQTSILLPADGDSFVRGLPYTVSMTEMLSLLDPLAHDQARLAFQTMRLCVWQLWVIRD